MNRNLVIALVLIALLVILFIFNRGQVEVDLLVTRYEAMKSVVFLCFVGAGVIIGILLKS
jgi:uncharacterized integral membrane protein